VFLDVRKPLGFVERDHDLNCSDKLWNWQTRLEPP
jgi:hypothetical protein